jgi:hypothetical protein
MFIIHGPWLPRYVKSPEGNIYEKRRRPTIDISFSRLEVLRLKEKQQEKPE